MAKTGFWLRGARGKFAGAVLAKGADGQTIQRELVKPSNPRTAGQMAQRAIFATVASAYSQMKVICDHSFEGVEYGQKTQQEFFKEALKLMRTRAAADEGNFLIPNVSALMANPYIVSKGSLSSPQHIYYSTSDAQILIEQMNNPTLGTDVCITAKSWCEALGVNKGDQITLVAIVRDANQPVIGTYAGREYRRNKFEYARITVKANASDNDVVFNGATLRWGDAAIIEGLTSLNSNGAFEMVGITGDGATIEMSNEILAFACIRSQKVGNTWLRSYETMTLADEQLVYNFNDMLPAWTENGGSSLEFANAKILNNAEQNAGASVLLPTYSLFKTSYIAETPAGEQDMVVNCACVLKKAGDSMSYAPITDENRHVYTVKDNGHLLLNENISTSGIEYSVAQASLLIGEALVIDQN